MVMRAFPRFILSFLLLLGFAFRLNFLLGGIYHVDEFISMLAAKMVAQRGLPILPSGILYDHGLLFSFLSGSLVALFGFTETIARWPSLIASTLTIAAYYFSARRLFASPLAGLFAAALATFDELSILWGGRARMYAVGQLTVLLTITWLLDGTLHQPTARKRFIFLGCLAAMTLSHTVTLLILPPLTCLLALFTWGYRADWLKQPRLGQQAILAALILGGAVLIIALGQNGQAVTNETPAAPTQLGFLGRFLGFGFSWGRFDDLLGYFFSPTYLWLTVIIFSGLFITLYRYQRGQANFAEIAFLFLSLLIALSIFEQGALFSAKWQKTRYLFLLAMPAYFLLAAQSLALLTGFVRRIPISQPNLTMTLQFSIGLLLISGLWGQQAWKSLSTVGTGNYDTAFALVQAQRQPDDKIMTGHPSAAYLYAGQCDYYAKQGTARLIINPNDEGEELVDRYTASPLVDSVESLNAALANSSRLWFVVDKGLYEGFEPFFVQQIFAQMRLVNNYNGIMVFLKRPEATPLPPEPDHTLTANFSNMVTLGGYHLQMTPSGQAQLSLYWRPMNPPSQVFKVFVQLRDESGQTLAQADHLIYDGLLTLDLWQKLQQQNEWLREVSTLPLPTQVDSNTSNYLYIGLYNPATLERVPLQNDSSGENAVIIPLTK